MFTNGYLFIGCKLIFFSETKICKLTQLFGTCTSMTESCGVQTSVIHIWKKKACTYI